MKKKSVFKKYDKVSVTLLVIVIVIALSVFVSLMISRLEEEACWERIYQAADQMGADLKVSIQNDTNILESIATVIAQQDTVECEEVQNIINTFESNTVMSYIALLLPGDRVMRPNQPVCDAGDILSFEEEAALGKHVSDRSVDIEDRETLLLRNFVPVVKDGETVAMLYGVAKLEDFPEKWEYISYNGEAAMYVIDGNTGDFIMDTWHKSLGNILELGERTMKKGYSPDQLLDGVLNRETGQCVFVSKSIGEYLYFYYQPIEINRWVGAISVPEGVAFGRLRQVNQQLIVFNVMEILVLLFYFIWIMRVTEKEVSEKQKLAEWDVLSGLQNRNCYEQRLPLYPKTCKTELTCIFVDVNGLHELNNGLGHEAGDRMLQCVASVLRERFGAKDTFRIGGDEFVAFVKDESLEEIEAKLKEIGRFLATKGYHVSIGMCSQEVPVNIDSLVKQAEKHMYEDKKRYYEERGIDRRSRA